MITDPIANLLTRVRNAQRAGHKSCRVPKSKMGLQILAVLQSEGFLGYVEEIAPETTAGTARQKGKFGLIEVGLKYYSSGEPVIRELRRMSKPGRRYYVGAEELKPVHAGLGISVLSTSQGVISDRKARKLNVGGELLATLA